MVASLSAVDSSTLIPPMKSTRVTENTLVEANDVDRSNNSNDSAVPTMKRSGSKSCLKKSNSDPNLVSSSTGSTMRKNVSFHKIEINEFPLELGDNPSATGVPIQLGWEPQRTTTVDLDHYETKRPIRRDKFQLHIPPVVRRAWVRDQGVAISEIDKITTEKDKIRKSRHLSIRSRKWDTVNEKLESAKRKIQQKLKKVPSWTSLAAPSAPKSSEASSASILLMPHVVANLEKGVGTDENQEKKKKGGSKGSSFGRFRKVSSWTSLSSSNRATGSNESDPLTVSGSSCANPFENRLPPKANVVDDDDDQGSDEPLCF